MVKKFFSVFLLCALLCVFIAENSPDLLPVGTDREGNDYIKWVDFDVTYQALRDAMDVDIETYEQDLHISWTDILSFLAAKYGGDFSSYRFSDIEALTQELNEGKSMEDLTKNMKSYDYYHEAYSAVIGNFLGLREDGSYGLTAYSPLSAGYLYTESDDFGNGRSYGFARKHLGHDMFCSVGTPVVAVESGKVEALGWNQYGGWRIGIRSSDGFRYYYYAHLRKDSPYAEGLKEGDTVKAGQIIGYTGQTGYSIKENVNNINVPHLHFGMQLIFDESQKECNAEIWIDTYALIQLLSKHRQSADSRTASASSAETGENSGEEIPVPILMYHALTRRESQVNDYTIPAYLFESDVKYLKEHGYTAVTMSELIDYVYDTDGNVSLPDKPVVLTFDDGFCNNYNYATPILEKYGMNLGSDQGNGRQRTLGNSKSYLRFSQYEKRTKRRQQKEHRDGRGIRSSARRRPEKAAKQAARAYGYVSQYVHLALRRIYRRVPGHAEKFGFQGYTELQRWYQPHKKRRYRMSVSPETESSRSPLTHIPTAAVGGLQFQLVHDHGQRSHPCSFRP